MLFYLDDFSWFFLLLWVFITSVFVFFLFCAVFLLISRPLDYEKLTAYECGFNPFDDVIGKFDVRFYLVAILFIIFDLEVTFLFPWSIVMGFLGFLGFWTMVFFLCILILGFIYELKRGSLDW